VVLEGNAAPGGLASSFARGPYTFDAAVDSVSLVGPGEAFAATLEAVGLTGAVRWLPLQIVREVVIGGERISITAGMPAFRRFLHDRYPAQRENVDRLLRTIETLAQEAPQVPLHLLDQPETWRRFFPTLAAHLSLTYSELLEKHVSDPELRGVLSERSHFLGLGSDRLSCVSMAVLVASYYGGVVGRVAGGLGQLIQAIVRRLEEAGATLRTRCPVTDMVRAEDGAGGPCATIVSGDEEICRARTVVGACDARRFWSLLDAPGTDAEHPSTGDPFACDVSCSFVIAYLTGRPGGIHRAAGSSIGVWPRANELELGFGFTLPTLLDTTVAPPGEATAVLHIPVLSPVNGPAERDRLINEAVAAAEGPFPDLLSAMDIAATAGPDTLERYGAGPGGPAFGWLHTPERLRLLARQERCLPPGCYLAGNWQSLCAGVPSSAVSGHRTALRILRERRTGTLG
jgi:prolycopene isomerase